MPSTGYPPHSHGLPMNNSLALKTFGGFATWKELTKLKLTSMATLPAALAFLAAPAAREKPALQIALILGVLASASGAAALNEWSERHVDSRMHRTRLRPLPAGQLSPRQALSFGLLLTATGISVLALFFNLLAASLALAAAIIYWLLYTPLKKRTPWCTEVGAISGALSPLVGWAAAEATLSLFAWMLFAILFFWQMPHFHPIAWRYRNDYARGGLRMRVLTEPTGNQAASYSIFYAAVLTAVSLLPFLTGQTGPVSAVTAGVTGILFLFAAVRFRFAPDRDQAARALFRFSLIYLPVVLIALTMDAQPSAIFLTESRAS